MPPDRQRMVAKIDKTIREVVRQLHLRAHDLSARGGEREAYIFNQGKIEGVRTATNAVRDILIGFEESRGKH